MNNQIVFQLKQTLARLVVLVLNIDHIFMEYVRGAIKPVFTGRVKKITDIEKSGKAMTPALPNKIRGFEANYFINNLDIKLYGRVPYLYALFSHSIHDDFYLVSLELKLSPWRHSFDIVKKIEIEKVADFFGIRPSYIDFTNLEITKCLSNMSNGAICEAFRLYGQNYSQFNLPAQLQVAVLEDTVRLQNVGHFLELHEAKSNC